MELGEGMQGGLTKRSIIFQGTFAELPELREEIAERRVEAQHLNEQTLYPLRRVRQGHLQPGTLVGHARGPDLLHWLCGL